MELSFELKTLEPLAGALDIIRFLGKLDDPIANASTICEEIGLSDRTFGKAIRRLVTKGYVQMDGDQVYRLTEQGSRAVEEIAAYDEAGPVEEESESETTEQMLRRRLVMVLPRKLVAGKTQSVHIGFNAAGSDQAMGQPADMLMRFSVINGDPAELQETTIELSNNPAQRTFQVTPRAFNRVRLRIQVFQLEPYSGDIYTAGGMYVDAEVVTTNSSAELAAYGTDVSVVPIA